MSQYKIVEDVIISLFEMEVQRNKNSEHYIDGIHFCVHIDAENYGYEKDGNTHHPEWYKRADAYVHMILVYPHSVFMAVTNSTNMPKPEEFKNTSNHDSCWRSDGVEQFAWLGFDLWDQAYSHIPKDHRPQTRGIGILYNMTPGLMDIYRKVKVKHKPINETDSYHRELTEIKKCLQN